jgi:5-methylcytosine-specific restriction endonuclease McrA
MASYYATREWKDIKNAVIRKDGYKCQRCGSKRDLVVHHIQPRNDGGADIESNLKTVCKPCHIKEHRELAATRGGTGKYAPTDDELRAMGIEL